MGTAGEGSPAFDASKDAIRIDSVRAGEAALRVHLWEPVEPCTTTLTTLSDVVVARTVGLVTQVRVHRSVGAPRCSGRADSFGQDLTHTDARAPTAARTSTGLPCSSASRRAGGLPNFTI
jgi:hypothetical protein